jgi:hypothetical protein
MVASKFGPSLSRGERPWTAPNFLLFICMSCMSAGYIRAYVGGVLKGRELGRRQVSEALVR